MDKVTYSKENQLSRDNESGVVAEFEGGKFQQGDKVYHRSSGAPMVVIAVDGNNVKTRWIGNDQKVEVYIFFDFELELEPYTDDLSTFKEIQKLNNDAQLLQTNLALKNLSVQSNGLTMPDLKRKFPKPRY